MWGNGQPLQCASRRTRGKRRGDVADAPKCPPVHPNAPSNTRFAKRTHHGAFGGHSGASSRAIA